MDETLYVYSATSYGERIGRDIGALSMREGDKEALEHAGERSDFIREALIWNQIILNRMVYQKELRRFHTFKRIAVKKWRTVTIPLELREDNTTFVMYRVLSGTGKEVLKSVIDDWNAYAGIMCQYMVLVLVFDIRITRIGTFQDIMGHAYSHLEVVSTSVDDWISVHEGTVTRYQVALSDMRRISDTVG